MWGSNIVNVENWKPLTRLVGHTSGQLSRPSLPESQLTVQISSMLPGPGMTRCSPQSDLTTVSGYGMATRSVSGLEEEKELEVDHRRTYT